MPTSPSDDFNKHVSKLAEIVRKARKNGFGIASRPGYAAPAREALVGIKKTFSMLRRNFPPERYSGVAIQLASIEPLIEKLVEVFPSDLKGMASLLSELSFKSESDLAAELELPQSQQAAPTEPPFLPEEIIEDRHGIPKKILWEVNRCYDASCYNACAAMIRHLIEMLIVGAFEHHNLSEKIKDNGDYLPFSALIGKATAEPAFKLGKETKRVLPDLKFFGDAAAHSRMILVRKHDLDRMHNKIRGAVEEFSRNL
jgi:hypothetical protein